MGASFGKCGKTGKSYNYYSTKEEIWKNNY
jgi:hypothetical protein